MTSATGTVVTSGPTWKATGSACYERLFTGQPPTSTTVEVLKLFRPGALLEVEVTATTAT